MHTVTVRHEQSTCAETSQFVDIIVHSLPGCFIVYIWFSGLHTVHYALHVCSLCAEHVISYTKSKSGNMINDWVKA